MVLSFRNISALVIARLLIGLGLVRAAKKKALDGAFILSVYFHNPSKKEFESCIKWLKKNDFQFLSAFDLEQIIHGAAPFPIGGVLLTVDDGWKSNLENVVAVANEQAVPVTIFVSTAPVEGGVFWWSYCLKNKPMLTNHSCSLATLKKIPNNERLAILSRLTHTVLLRREALTVEQVVDISRSKYITIGGHTHNHPILPNCDNVEVVSEITLCKQRLESWTGKNVHYFAYPNGDFGDREKQILRESGWHLAFGIQQKYLTPSRLKDPLELPRFCFIEGASFEENLCRVTGVWKFSKQSLKQMLASLRQQFHFVVHFKRRAFS